MLKIVLTSTLVSTMVLIVWEFIKTKVKFKQSKQLQVDNFYREISGNKMYKVLEKWSEFLFFATDKKVEGKLKDDRYLNNLLHETYIYSSSETCKRMSNFQQHLYIFYKEDKDNKSEYHDILVLVAGIITSLKHDFTGEWISIEDTLRVKLTDFEKNRDKFRQKIRKYEYNKRS